MAEVVGSSRKVADSALLGLNDIGFAGAAAGAVAAERSSHSGSNFVEKATSTCSCRLDMALSSNGHHLSIHLTRSSKHHREDYLEGSIDCQRLQWSPECVWIVKRSRC